MKKLLSVIAFLCIFCTAPLAWPGPYFTQGINTGAMGTVAFGDGTVLLPSITFTSDPNTGWYWIGADNLGLSLGGVKVWDITKPTATFYQSKTSDGSAAGLYVYSHTTAATGNNDTLTSFRAQGEYSFTANTLRDYVGYNVANFVLSAGTLTNQYGIYLDNLTSATNNWAIYTAGGEVTNVFKAAQNLTLDARTTAHTDVDGVLDINLTSLTTNNKALDIDTLGTSVTGVIQYGILNTLTHSTVLTSVNHTMYGNYNGVTKSGADTSADTTTLYGNYTVAGNTGSTDAGTKNTYATWSVATGDTAGTSTAYGIYAAATGADTNWAGYFNGSVYASDLSVATLTVTNLPNHEIYVDGGRSDTYTADGSMLKPYKTVVLAVAAIETDAAIHIAATDYQSTTYVVRIAPGTYSGNFTLTNEKYLRFEGFGVILSGIITLTQSEQVGDYYSRLEFKGMEGTRARRGQSFTITGAINGTTGGHLTYLHFDGVNLTGALSTGVGVFVTHFNNCYVSGALDSTAGQMMIETTNHNEFASAMTGNIAFRDVRDAIFLSGTINITPQDVSRITNTRFDSGQSVTITASQTLSIDSASLKSLLATTENLTTMVLDFIDFPVPPERSLAAANAITLSIEQVTGKFLNNYGQIALNDNITYTLPAAAANYAFSFTAGETVAKFVRFDANAADFIYLDGVVGDGAGEYIGVASVVIGNGISCRTAITAAANYDWFCFTIAGPWTKE